MDPKAAYQMHLKTCSACRQRRTLECPIAQYLRLQAEQATQQEDRP